MFIRAQGPNGEPVVVACDAAGNLTIAVAPIGPVSVQSEPSRAINSDAYEGSRVLSATPGTLRSVFIQLDPALPTATYYAHLLIASAVPADGVVTFLRPPFAVAHVNGNPTQFVFDEGMAGIAFGTGCVICVSSTQFTKTEVPNAALFAGSVL